MKHKASLVAKGYVQKQGVEGKSCEAQGPSVVKGYIQKQGVEGKSCEAQGSSGGEGLRPEARSGLRRGVRTGGKIGICPPIAGDHDTSFLGGPPHGHEVRFPQR